MMELSSLLAHHARYRPHATAVVFDDQRLDYRVFDTRVFTLDEFQRISRLVAGATVDDAVLAVCAGGLRRYLEEHGELPEADLAVTTPAHPDLADPRHHKARAVQLGTLLQDPLQRLGAILFAGRWPGAVGSPWTRAMKAGRITMIQLGPMQHNVTAHYFDPATVAPDGRSYLQVSTDAIAAVLTGREVKVVPVDPA